MRISDWSSDVCSSVLIFVIGVDRQRSTSVARHCDDTALIIGVQEARCCRARAFVPDHGIIHILAVRVAPQQRARAILRSEEHTSELQSLMRISYAVFCLKKKKKKNQVTK